jgi:hypothetical protein
MSIVKKGIFGDNVGKARVISVIGRNGDLKTAETVFEYIVSTTY